MKPFCSRRLYYCHKKKGVKMKKTILVVAAVVFSLAGTQQSSGLCLSDSSIDERQTDTIKRFDAERNDSIRLGWFTHNFLLSDAEENYQFKSTAAIKPYYSDQNSAWSINEEWLAFHATDSTQVDKRIAPVNGLSSPANDTDNAQGSLSVSFVANGYLPGQCFLENDSRTCNDLYPDINTTNTEAVCYGRILYRSAVLGNGQPWGPWNVAFYSANTVLTFSGQQALQFVVIYEVGEPAAGFFRPTRYYHVRGVYRIDLYQNS